MKFDFSGWATRANLRCSDGRTILKDAFCDQDGATVPLVWNHQHNTPENVLGHAQLENREEGVYAYCTFNETESGNMGRELVQHGDITALSIFANQLKQNGSNVVHGAIREVSLVLAGANPGAKIESVIAHGEESEEEAYIFTGENLTLYHAEEGNAPEAAKEEPKTDDNQNGDEEDDSEETVEDVINSMTDKQRQVMYGIIGELVGDEEEDDEEEVEHSEILEGEEEIMRHNLFENNGVVDEMGNNVLTHADMKSIINDARAMGGSLKTAIESRINDGTLAHTVTDDEGNTVTYGIANIDYLFPDARKIANEPDFIMRNQDWVTIVMNGVHASPFSRVKAIHADITMEEARAKGYVKAATKAEEVFALLKRSVSPTTVYKKQKLDRDDILDIVDMDVVAWMKREMRMMLNEELARAFLIGDGRSAASADKINPLNIIPIWTDAALYTINKTVTVASTATNDQKATACIDGVIEAMADYEGSGNPVMFCDKWFITRSMLMRNSIGERLYKTQQELADEMGVSKLVPVPVFKNQSRTVTPAGGSAQTHNLVAIIANLSDYNVGTDKGGDINMFDDFDIDVNQYKYLIETRCSGMLIRPYSAVALEMVFQ